MSALPIALPGTSGPARSALTHHVIDPALRFGGFRQSGWGREMRWNAIELYTETKSISAAL
jgi:acyl-CoA reductase-like NAD-dependent aldehyde dehydrogenase